MFNPVTVYLLVMLTTVLGIASIILALGTTAVNGGVKVEMIKTLPLLTIPLLGATPSVVLVPSDSWVLTVTGMRLS